MAKRIASRMGRVLVAVLLMTGTVVGPTPPSQASDSGTYYTIGIWEPFIRVCGPDLVLDGCSDSAVPVVNYTVGSGWNSTMRARIQDAIAEWNSVPLSDHPFEFDWDGHNNSISSNCLDNGYNENGHHWDSLTEDRPGVDKLGEAQICTFQGTRVTTEPGREIHNFQIRYDTKNRDGTNTQFYFGASRSGLPSTENDFQATVTHELGHGTGWIGHFPGGPPDCPGDANENTMCEFLLKGEWWQRTLGAHDQTNFQGAYDG